MPFHLLHFELRSRLNLRRRRKAFIACSEFFPSKALSKDASHCSKEPALITAFVFPLVEAESLLVEIAEKVKGFDGNIGVFDRALEQIPNVFHAVRMDVAFDVARRVIDDLVCEISRKPFIREQLGQCELPSPSRRIAERWVEACASDCFRRAAR